MLPLLPWMVERSCCSNCMIMPITSCPPLWLVELAFCEPLQPELLPDLLVPFALSPFIAWLNALTLWADGVDEFELPQALQPPVDPARELTPLMLIINDSLSWWEKSLLLEYVGTGCVGRRLVGALAALVWSGGLEVSVLRANVPAWMWGQ